MPTRDLSAGTADDGDDRVTSKEQDRDRDRDPERPERGGAKQKTPTNAASKSL